MLLWRVTKIFTPPTHSPRKTNKISTHTQTQTNKQKISPATINSNHQQPHPHPPKKNEVGHQQSSKVRTRDDLSFVDHCCCCCCSFFVRPHNQWMKRSSTLQNYLPSYKTIFHLTELSSILQNYLPSYKTIFHLTKLSSILQNYLPSYKTIFDLTQLSCLVPS